MFALTKYGVEWPLYVELGAPVFSSALVFIGLGFLNNKTVSPEIEDMLSAISKSDEELANDKNNKLAL